MPIHNSDVAEIFNKMADLLEIEGANRFRVRAYQDAARTITGFPKSLKDMVEEGEDLSELPGIGKDLAGKIKEIVETGELSQLKKLGSKTPVELSNLMKVAGLGPKRVKALYENLGITGLKELKKAAEEEKIRKLEGFGKKTEQSILEELDQEEEKEERIKLPAAEERADSLVEYLKSLKGVKEIVVAGSFRRRKETVGDLDILATCRKGSKMMDHFTDYDDVKKVISQGKTRSTVVLRSGLHVDLRLVPLISYGAALHYFTGSKAHNIAIRKLGVKKGLKINEYGVFKGKKRIAGKSEKEVFEQVGLPYIEPELRENRGEIEAAKKDRLPELITLDHIRGDLHSHTNASDGHHSLKEMAEAAKERGYEYLAITEHSKKVRIAHGLDAKRLKKHIKAIDRLNENLDGIILLKGIEVDILEDGSLDLPDEIFVDMEQLMEAALDRGCFLELNAHPDRLDLSDTYCRMAKDMRLKLAISTDAHSTTDLDFMRFGLGQARRGWLEPEDVLNTKSLKQLKKELKRK